jgi:cytochrome c-type biogenesis protein CcmE
MTKRELIEGYRRLSDEDRRVFHRWLIGNVVVATISIIGLITIAIGLHDSSHFNNSPSVTQKKIEMSNQVEAAPLARSSNVNRDHSSRNGGYRH